MSHPMTSRFRDKLKQIRDASQKRSAQSHRERTEEDIQRSQLTVAAFEFREQLEAVIDDFGTGFPANPDSRPFPVEVKTGSS